MEDLKLNCFDTCPFVRYGFRPCTEKVAHAAGDCRENIASNFRGQVRVQIPRGGITDVSGQNPTEVLQKDKRIATVRDGRITMIGATPQQAG